MSALTRGLTLAENEKGRFVAVDEHGAVHYLSAAALGEKPWEVQRELEAAFKGEGVVQLPGVAEVRGELQAQRAEEREAARHQRALERAVQWEENRSIWKEQRQLDRQIERVEAALERPQGAVLEAIGRAYAESSNGAEFVNELEQRGLMVCRVSAEEAERSRMQRAVLGTTPRYEEGDVVAMTERGHTYRINAETIAMTATTTYDHVQNVKERLASIEPQEVLSLSQAQEVVVERANERGAMPMPEVDSLPSVGQRVRWRRSPVMWRVLWPRGWRASRSALRRSSLGPVARPLVGRSMCHPVLHRSRLRHRRKARRARTRSSWGSRTRTPIGTRTSRT